MDSDVMESDTHPAEGFPVKAHLVAHNFRISGSGGMKPLATCPPLEPAQKETP